MTLINIITHIFLYISYLSQGGISSFRDLQCA